VRNKELRRRAAGALGLAVLAFAPGAGAQLFKDDALYERMRQVETQRAGDVRRVDGLESRIDTRAEAQGRMLLDANAQLESLKQEIARLRGQIEVLTNELENAAKRQKDFYVDLDGRVRKLETPPVVENKQPKPPSPEEQKAYEAGLNLIKAANYRGAVDSFNGFLKAYPASMLAASAQYWIGNALFALRDYKGAISAQQHVVDTWPDDPKAAVASAQTDLKDIKAARATLDTLIRKYPQSDAAATARQRLAKLR
jgi:tol-pal system protein YbgF